MTLTNPPATLPALEGEPPAAEEAPRSAAGPRLVGSRVREERLRQKIGVRELARRVGVSASLISQVELGKASPSVGTLYAIVSELSLSLDELFFESAGRAGGGGSGAGEAVSGGGNGDGSRMGSPTAGEGAGPVVRRDAGKTIQLATGVRWQRLTQETPHDVDFLDVTYPPGSESCPADSLMRHSGREYGHVVSGRLGVTIGFDTYELGPGDSVSFESSEPHRLFTLGSEPVRAIWFVVGRRRDPRLHGEH